MAVFNSGNADPTENITNANAGITYIPPKPIYSGYVSGVKFISTTIPPLATNIIVIGYTNKTI